MLILPIIQCLPWNVDKLMAQDKVLLFEGGLESAGLQLSSCDITRVCFLALARLALIEQLEAGYVWFFLEPVFVLMFDGALLLESYHSIGQGGGGYKRYRGDSAIKHYFLVANIF